MKATIPLDLASEIVVKSLSQYKKDLTSNAWSWQDEEHNKEVIKAINIILKEFK